MKITEYSSSIGKTLRVDRENGLIHGVKLLGHESKNGRVYTPEALRNAAGLYEGAKVNVNHPKGDPRSPRDYQDRLGHVEKVRVESDGLYGDFRFNPKHALAEQLVWDAENAPQNVGFSHNVQAKTATKNGKQHIEAITKVNSVDLVADPATTNGLYEQVECESMDQNSQGSDSVKAAFRAAVIQAFDDESLDNKATLAKIKTILTAQEKLMGVTTPEPKPEEKPVETPTEAVSGELKALREQISALESKNLANEKEILITKELAEAKLPEQPAYVMESLRNAKDAAARKAIMDDRRAISRYGSPKSREQGTTESVSAQPDAKAAVSRWKS